MTPSGPELVIGLFDSVGTDLNNVYSQIQPEMDNVGYVTDLIHLIELLPDFDRSYVDSLS